MQYALVWLRRDLRLGDNPALQAALEAGLVPVPVYIQDVADGDLPAGGASAWWLHHSLTALDRDLRDQGSRLLLRRGDPARELPALARQLGTHKLFWNRRYEPHHLARDRTLKHLLGDAGLDVQDFPGNLLREPWQLLKADGTPYRVFTPYWKALQRTGITAGSNTPLAWPTGDAPEADSLPLGELQLLPAIPWDAAFPDVWRPGEAGAWQSLDRFCTDALVDYPTDRDRPDLPGTSRLSPHLHFGEISPRQLWTALSHWGQQHARPGTLTAIEAFQRQLAWRDFAHQLLHHFPHTAREPLDRRFAQFPWARDYAEPLRRWQRGQTGIPIVDAGMRELWHSGWMHNRVRMIAASLLTKNLRIPWQEGADWFMDTLVDADLANNTLGWQWVAGCGADAAPYFRIFNPVRQGERFDPDGAYVRRWVPELGRLPAKWIHCPWEAPAAVLEAAGIEPGRDYPAPMVDLAASRTRALAAWEEIKSIPR
ncbi:MAG: DNA photolyase family protein [Xanthomonadaceae bacterium]|nr:DNA photolyase family protein [Xanthomonadaceae bacterium]